MTPKALKALKGSIKKWEGIVAGTTRDEAISSCPLCKEFYEPICQGCPVSKHTGFIECDRTPYRDQWCKVAGEGHLADTPERVSAAHAELNFLRSLLPKKKPTKR